MKKPLVRNRLLLLVLLAFVLTGQGRVYGYVWCFGEDGHTRMESALGGSCGGEEGADAVRPCPSAAPEPSVAAADEHCGPCLDLPAASDSLQSRIRNGHDLSSELLPPAGATAPAVPVFIRVLTANLTPQPPPRPDVSLLVLRSVVQRC